MPPRREGRPAPTGAEVIDLARRTDLARRSRSAAAAADVDPAGPDRVTPDPGTLKPGASTGADLARAALARAVEASSAAAATRAEQDRGRRSADARSRRAATRAARARAAGDSPDPLPFGELLAGFLRSRGWERPLAVASVQARWPDLVGPDVAARCAPVSLTDGVLTLSAESTAWATQLRLLSATMLRRITDGLGADVVRSIRVQGPTGPSWRRGPLHVRGRGPRDTYG